MSNQHHLEEPDRNNNSLRVLAVIPANEDGCSFIFARRQVESLRDLGLNVKVFFLKSRTSLPTILKEWQRLKSEIAQFHPDIVHAHYGTVTAFLCAMTTFNFRLVITFRGNDLHADPDVGFLRLRLGHLLSQLAALRAEAIICVSQGLLQRLWWRHDRAHVIPSGVDLNIFAPQSQREARARLGWEQDARIVLFNQSGGHPRMKGGAFVQRALRIAEQTVGPIRLVSMGGDVAPGLVPVYLNAADCVALASVNEGSPNIVKEALACNVPIISTDVGDVAERLRDVTPSRVVPRDVSSYARALCDLLRQARRSNGRSRVTDCSTWAVADAIRGVYETSMSPSRKQTQPIAQAGSADIV